VRLGKKSIAISLLGIICIFLLQACGVNLSDKEASSIIIAHEKLPQMIFLNAYGIGKTEPLYQVINRLVGEGYAVNANKKIGDQHDSFSITEKGKPLLESLEWNGWAAAWNAQIYTSEVSLKSIKELLIDKDAKSAEVTGVFQQKLTDNFKNLRAEVPEYYKFKNIIDQTYEKKYTMKKWDKGWRIE
jgi:hypothetical protein